MYTSKFLLTLLSFLLSISLIYSQSSCHCKWFESPSLSIPDPVGVTAGTLQFGAAIGLNKNILAIASPLENDGLGAVRIYTRFSNQNHWVHRTELTAGRGNATGTFLFGQLVGVATDNNVVIAENGAATGTTPMIYSFERSGPSQWIEVIDSFTVTGVSRFTQLSVYSNLLIISSPARPSGIISVFTKQHYNWELQDQLSNPEIPSQYIYVAVAGNSSFVATTTVPSVHFYDVSGDPGSLSFSDPVIFALPAVPNWVAIAPSGLLAFVALPTAIQIFARDSFGDWNQTDTLSDYNGIPFNNVARVVQSGSYLVVSDNQQTAGPTGTKCAPCSTCTGAVYVYTKHGSVWNPTTFLRPATLDDNFGKSLAFSSNQGNLIVVGGVEETVYTFMEQGSIAPLPSCAPTPS